MPISVYHVRTLGENMNSNSFQHVSTTMAELVTLAIDSLDPIYKNNLFNFKILSDLQTIKLNHTKMEYTLLLGDFQLAVCDLFLEGYRNIGISCIENDENYSLLFHCPENEKNILCRIKLKKLKRNKQKRSA